jgi:hypothetical protein
MNMEKLGENTATIFLCEREGTKLKAAMELAGFAKGEIEDLTLQQRIRRMITKKRGELEIPPPPSAIIISTYESPLGTLGPPSSTTDRTGHDADRRDKRKKDLDPPRTAPWANE